VILALSAKKPLGSNAWAFTFLPEHPVPWRAGQFVKIDVPHPLPDAKGTSRRFTIAAAPHEKAFTIATRVTDSTFKQALAKLPIGGKITLLDTPAGDFIWQPASYPHVFVAQGIGITPFYAIIKDRHHHNLPTNAHLIYSNHPANPVLFQSELAAWTAADSSLRITYLSEPATPAALADLAPDLPKRLVYVSGPKPLIALAMPPYNLPLSQLKQDYFPGYPAATY
jgi:ferredoxin-NADP reductase